MKGLVIIIINSIIIMYIRYAWQTSTSFSNKTLTSRYISLFLSNNYSTSLVACVAEHIIIPYGSLLRLAIIIIIIYSS